MDSTKAVEILVESLRMFLISVENLCVDFVLKNMTFPQAMEVGEIAKSHQIDPIIKALKSFDYDKEYLSSLFQYC